MLLWASYGTLENAWKDSTLMLQKRESCEPVQAPPEEEFARIRLYTRRVKGRSALGLGKSRPVKSCIPISEWFKIRDNLDGPQDSDGEE